MFVTHPDQLQASAKLRHVFHGESLEARRAAIAAGAHSPTSDYLGVSMVMGVPNNVWLIREKPLKLG